MGYSFDQGLIARKMSVEELFHESTVRFVTEWATLSIKK